MRLVRLVERDRTPKIRAVRAKRGKVFGMRALAVQEELRGRGLAAEAIRRLQGELGWVDGSEYKLVVNLASCMRKEGVGFYSRQGWVGAGGVWEWSS